MGQIELVVFDMAGTTVRDEGQVPQALRAALSEQGVEASPEIIQSIRGASKREALQRLLPATADREQIVTIAYGSFRTHLARLYANTAQSVPGATEAFSWLRGQGIKVALNTGFDRETTQMLLAALRWTDGMVDTVVCGDDVKHGRPAPDMILRCMEMVGITSAQRVANVGDTVLDLQAGHNAKVRLNIGVLSGAHSAPLLLNEPHTYLIASVADLPGLLTKAIFC